MNAPPGRTAGGGFLLEALVALVVFSLALLGLATSVAAALRHIGDAQWRSDAVDIGAAAIARMHAEDPVTLPDRYDRDGDGYRALFAQAARLPGISAAENVPIVEIDDTAEARQVRVTLFWRHPWDVRVHEASVSAVLPRP